MKCDYIEAYAKRFKLQVFNGVCYEKAHPVVMKASNKYILYKNAKNKWSAAKQSDLLISVINDIPLHC
tara:strand:- start:236 stop:439 length:204 start_codon:yes stop_codon:yes gene_type:complete